MNYNRGEFKAHVWKQVFNVQICAEKIRMCLHVPGLQSAQSRKAVLWRAKICPYMTETNPSSWLKERLKFFHRFHQTHDVLAGHHCSEWLTVPAVLRCISVLPLTCVVTHGQNSSATVVIPLDFPGSECRAEPLKSGLINQWLSLSYKCSKGTRWPSLNLNIIFHIDII